MNDNLFLNDQINLKGTGDLNRTFKNIARSCIYIYIYILHIYTYIFYRMPKE